MIRRVLSSSLLLAGLCAAPVTFAATPASGTITMTGGVPSPTLNYSTGPMPVANASPFVTGRDDYDCNQTNPCDTYLLTIDLPADFRTTHPAWRVKIVTTAVPAAADIDFQVRRNEDNSLVGVVRDNPPAQPTFVYQPRGGRETLKLQITPGSPVPDATASVTLYKDPAFEGAVIPVIVAGGPNFRSYPYSSGGASEPTMGINLATNAGYYINGLTVVKGTWNANGDISYSSLGTAGAVESLDPFLTVDQFPLANGQANPRIWVAHLLGGTSYMAFSDNDGATWTRSTGPGQVHGADNESIVVGPYPAVKPATAAGGTYEHAMYYCSHGAVNAFCSRSDDGGLTFKPSRPIFPADASCSNHGHVKVGHDGTVFVPMNNTCQGTEGVSISIDAGETWHYIAVPGTFKGRWDPSIAMANDGKTVWFGYAEEGDDRPMIVKGILDKSNPAAPTINWQLPATDVGVPANLKNIAFATVVAGDPDRAAFAFHGTDKAGDSGTIQTFTGATWHLYVATTFDGGKTWNLRNATPNDPTQRNDICDQGTSCATTGNHRNLLDFMDMDIDSEGRLVLIMADGCTGGCANVGGAANYSAVGTFVRQVDGKRMYAQFDPVESSVPGTPVLSGSRSGAGIALAWPAVNPGNGATLVGYDIERSIDGEAFTKISQTTGLAYTDTGAASPAAHYRYRIRALNSANTYSAYSATVDFLPATGISAACTLPGIVVATDAEGDQAATGSAASDIVSVAVAEPYTNDADKSLTFTLKVADLSTLPANVIWKVSFTVKDTAGTDRILWVEMHTKDPTSVDPLNGSLAPKFGYGWRDGTTDTGEGDGLITGSYAADGTIRIKLDIANPINFSTLTGAAAFTANLAPGTLVGSATGATQLLVGAQPAGIGGGSLQPLDSSAAGANYSVLGNRACMPNQVPTARLALVRTYDAVPDASIKADFDARGSTDDGTITSYTFTFGDGSDPVTNSSGLVSHTFTGRGGQGFPVRVRATDERGVTSLPSTLVQVLIPERELEPEVTPFHFIERTGVATGTFVTSEAVTLNAFPGTLPISGTNGLQYSINGGAYTNAAGSIAGGSTLRVRHVSADTADTAKESTVTVGGYSTVFRSVTSSVDRVPDAFTFGTKVDQAPATVVMSDVVTLQNFDVAPITAGPGAEYRINGGAWTAASGTLNRGDTLQLRHMTSSASLGYAKTYVKVGGVTGYFTTRTRK